MSGNQRVVKRNELTPIPLMNNPNPHRSHLKTTSQPCRNLFGFYFTLERPSYGLHNESVNITMLWASRHSPPQLPSTT